MSEALVFGTIGFWIATSIMFFFVCLCICNEKELHDIGAFLFLAVFFNVVYFCGNSESLNKCGIYLFNNPLTLFEIVFGYFLAGTVWSVVKWYFFLLNKRDEYIQHIKDFIPNNIVKKPYPPCVPVVSDYKRAIITWMIYWPFSMVCTILNDPVRRMFNFIYYKIHDYMQSMSDKMFESYVEKEKKD